MIAWQTYRPHFSVPQWGDVIAGLSVAGLLLPESVAYAAIAGLPPIHALLAAVIGLCVYAVAGSSRQAIVSPTSSAAAIFASAAALSSDMGFALLMVTGGLFLLAGALNGGFIASFISRPVMQGFAWSLAVMIMLKQVPHLLGLHTTAKAFFSLFGQIVTQLSAVVWPSALLGIGCLLAWLGLKWLDKRWLPPSLWVLIGGTLLSAGLHLPEQGVAVVGHIPLSGIRLHIPQLRLEQWLQVCELAPALLLIIFAESWESVRMLATRSHEKIDANRELFALGSANLLCGSAAALPVGAGYSACNASLSAGANGRWAGLFTALALVLVLLFARSALAMLPIPVLAAVVTGILARHFFPTELLQGLKFGADSWLALLCVLAVLSLGVMFGMVLAVGISLLLALYRFSQPLLSELGQVPGSHDYVDKAQHGEAQLINHLLIMRPEEPLFFANAERIFGLILDKVDQQHPKTVVLSLEASDSFDATTLYALQEFGLQLQQRQVHLALARVRDTVRNNLAHIHFEQTAALQGMYWSVDDAVRHVQ